LQYTKERGRGMQQQFDMLIVGNGILAYSTAYALILKDPNLKIALIGPASRTGSATIAAGAMLGAFGEVTKSGCSSYYGQVKLKLAVKASKLWDPWVRQLNESAEHKTQLEINQGTHIILNSQSGGLDDENYFAIIEALTEYKEPFQQIDPREIQGLNPIENYRPLKALYLPNEGSIDPNKLLCSLQKNIEASEQCSIIDDLVTQVYFKGNKITHVETQQGKIFQASQILLAAGVYNQELINQIPAIKCRIPRLVSGIGISIISEQTTSHPPQHVIRTPNRAGACGLHVLPRDQSLYIGATNNLSLIPRISPKMGHLNFLMQCAIEQMDQGLHNAKILTWSVGNRPVTMDSFPLIGGTSIHGLWLLTGTYRDGLHYSPLFAEYIAAKMLGQESKLLSDEDNIFVPERLPIQTMSKTEAIQEAVQHYVSGAYEHSMRLPRLGWDHMLKEMVLNKIEAIYDALDTDFVLSPDLFLMFDNDKEKHLAYFKDYFNTIDTSLYQKNNPLNKETKNLKKEVA
jgi:glycine oxidase